MVRQVILVRWKEDATDEMKRAVAASLLGLRAEIELIRDMRLGDDLGVRPDNFDFAVSVDFDTRDDYLAYRDHPAHLRVVRELIQPAMAERAGAVFDSP